MEAGGLRPPERERLVRVVVARERRREERVVDPGHLRLDRRRGGGRLDQLAERHRGRAIDHAEHAGCRRLGQREHERREVASVDPLQSVVGGRRREHLAAGGPPAHPRGEPVGGVVRTHDESGPDHARPVAEHCLHLALTGHLQRSVGLVGHVLGVGEGRFEHRGILVGSGGQVFGVRRERGDEAVPRAVRQGLGRGPHGARDVPAGIDHRVERAPRQGIDPFLPVADHMLRLREELGRGSMEQRDLVPTLDGHLGERAAREAGPADHQELHPSPPVDGASTG
jgi:hypothetical protein